jgi:quercetin dioxygenase-like cupin family protein
MKTVFAALGTALLPRSSAPFQRSGSSVKVVQKQSLAAPFEGMETTLVEVTYPPGAASAPHRHPGFILGYVLQGQFRFAVDGGAEQVLKPGEAFYEPSGALHTTSANAGTEGVTRILAFMVSPAGKPIVEPK